MSTQELETLIAKISTRELETLVSNLPPEKLRTFTDWFDAWREEQWDRQIEADVEAGRFDHIIKEVREAHRRGETTSL